MCDNELIKISSSFSLKIRGLVLFIKVLAHFDSQLVWEIEAFASDDNLTPKLCQSDQINR